MEYISQNFLHRSLAIYFHRLAHFTRDKICIGMHTQLRIFHCICWQNDGGKLKKMFIRWHLLKLSFWMFPSFFPLPPFCRFIRLFIFFYVDKLHVPTNPHNWFIFVTKTNKHKKKLNRMLSRLCCIKMGCYRLHVKIYEAFVCTFFITIIVDVVVVVVVVAVFLIFLQQKSVFGFLQMAQCISLFNKVLYSNKCVSLFFSSLFWFFELFFDSGWH